MPYCMFLLTGTFCTEKKDPCSSQPCGNRGKCEEHGEKYICMCPEGFTSSNCEVKLEHNCTTLGCQQEQAYGIVKHVRSYSFLLSIFLDSFSFPKEMIYSKCHMYIDKAPFKQDQLVT